MRFHLPKIPRTRRLPGALLLAGVLVVIPGLLTAKLLTPPKLCQVDHFTAATLPADQPPDEEAKSTEIPTVYLTFDDGPSKLTADVLDTLDKYGVKGSFFVIGEENEKYHPLLQRMASEGHCIALHSYSHSYKTIYSSREGFWEDLDQMAEIVEKSCGLSPKILRFPGGSSNSVCKRYAGKGLMRELVDDATEKGYAYVDWNVSAEDATGGHPSADTIAQRVIRGCQGKTQAVVLMHDTAPNKATLASLPMIIETLQEQGFRFSTVDQMARPCHHVKTSAEKAAAEEEKTQKA